MRARWIVVSVLLFFVFLWAIIPAFLNAHTLRGQLTRNDICFGVGSDFVGCLDNATLIPLFNGSVTAGNGTCFPELTFDVDGRFRNFTCVEPPVLVLNGSVIGPFNNNTLACTTVPTGTFGGVDLVSITIGCDGRVTNISNGGQALTENTTLNGDVTGLFSNNSLVTIPGLPANWSVGSSSCIPFLEGDNKGRITYETCINFTITDFTNGTVIQSTPHQTTVMTNGSVITIGTVQDIDTVSSPTFAGITINGRPTFNIGSPTPSITFTPTADTFIITGAAGISGTPVSAEFTPADAWYAGAGYPARIDQCRNAGDCVIMFDGSTSQLVAPPFTFNYIGSTPGVTPYAIQTAGNALEFLSFTQPGSPGDVVTPSVMMAMTPAATVINTPVQATSTLQVTGKITGLADAEVDGVLSLPNTPLYVNYGGTGSGASLTGGNIMVSVAGAHGGSIVESFAAPTNFANAVTISYPGGSHAATLFGFKNFGIVTLVWSGLGFSFNPSTDGGASVPAGSIPVGYRPSLEYIFFTAGSRGGVAGAVELYFAVNPDGSASWGFVDAATFNELRGFLGGTVWSILSTTATYVQGA